MSEHASKIAADVAAAALVAGQVSRIGKAGKPRPGKVRAGMRGVVRRVAAASAGGLVAIAGYATLSVANDVLAGNGTDASAIVRPGSARSDASIAGAVVDHHQDDAADAMMSVEGSNPFRTLTAFSGFTTEPRGFEPSTRPSTRPTFAFVAEDSTPDVGDVAAGWPGADVVPPFGAPRRGPGADPFMAMSDVPTSTDRNADANLASVTWTPGARPTKSFADPREDPRAETCSPVKNNERSSEEKDAPGIAARPTPRRPLVALEAEARNRAAVAVENAPATPMRPVPQKIVNTGTDERGRIMLSVNRTAELKTRVPIKRVSIGQPEVADVQPFSSNILLVTAKKPGTTQVIVWDDQDNSQSIDVNVEIPLDQLKDLIARVAPNATIEVAVANDQIVLRGQVPDLTVAKQVSDLAGAYGRVQNFIEVAGAQTVAVQVQFAEVSRQVTNSLGVSWGFNDGTSIFGSSPGGGGPVSFGTDPDTGLIDRLGLDESGGGADIFGLGQIGSTQFGYFIKALRDNSLLRVLQEPTLTTTSGEPASFLAGGQVAVPVPTDSGNTAIEYKEFGVRLKLTPIVLGNGKIRLVMEAESSDLDYTAGTTIQSARVPGLRTRRVQNTVELGEGQTLSVAGLLDDSVVATKQSIPLLGDIPVIGQLFRSTRYQRKETELVVLITPRLTGAMNPDQVTPLPGAAWRHPNELEQFAFGDQGGNAEADAVKDWNKKPSERGLKPGETQRNTDRPQEPAAITSRQRRETLPPPPAFIGTTGYAPAIDPEATATTKD